MSTLTPRQSEVMHAYIEHGSKEGAYRLGMSEQTFKNHMHAIRERLGYVTNAQAIYLLTAAGALRVEGMAQ